MTYNISEIEKQIRIDVEISYTEFGEYLVGALVELSQEKGEEYTSVQEYMEKNGKEELSAIAFNMALADSYHKIMDENRITVICEPKVETVTYGFESGGATIFAFVIDKAPEFTLGQYKNLEIKLDSKTPSVTPEEIERKKASILAGSTTFEPKEGALEDGDMSVIDFVGSVDGVEFEGGAAENYELLIGSGMFIPGFEEQMIGMEKGEVRVLKVRFPDEYAPELAGKDAEFKVTLHEIKVKVEPTMSDEFVKKYAADKGLNISTVAELDKVVREEIYNQKQGAIEKEIATKVEIALCENTKIDIPAEAVEGEVNYQLKNYEAQAAQYGLDLASMVSFMGMASVDALKEELAKQAQIQLSVQLILDKIVEAEGIEATDEEIEKTYEDICKTKGATREQVEAAVSRGRVANFIISEKAYKVIKETATIIWG